MKLKVFFNGMVNYSPSGQFRTSCEINAFYLPFDQQTCNIILTSLVGSSMYNNLTSSFPKIETEYLAPSNEWTLLETEVTDIQIPYDEFELSSIVFTLYLERKSSNYVITLMLPIIGLSLVGLMVFFLPLDSGEKISLSVACMMAFFITQLTIMEQLPSSWNSMPVISKYIMGSGYGEVPIASV